MGSDFSFLSFLKTKQGQDSGDELLISLPLRRTPSALAVILR
jgi:hypothetical protein